ncbi:MAG TPA: TonB C-terminal domain-containing protein [Candidatus Sulfotelmatobacter sp.]|nr:TonB C-terminal domain-containing protein [Candidatus Sulfotelmatobacter sp.]
MIPRTLVPKGARPPAADVATTRRRPSTLDERTLVPATLPIVRLDGHSTIPANLPLESIATRMVVPRDIDVEAVQRPEETMLPPQPTEMDERITIPQGVAPPEELPELPPVSEDLVAPDIIQTGELSFLPAARQPKTPRGEMIVAGSSLLLNLLFIIALVEVLTYRPHTREFDEIGNRQIAVLLPPGALEALKPSRAPAPRPPVKVDPRDIRKVAPTIEPPPPAPAAPPAPPKKDLPNAPVPQPNVAPPTPQQSQGAKGDLPKTPLKLESPDMPVPQSGLVLPKQTSPGDTIRDAARSTRMNSPAPIGGGSPYPGGRGGGGGGGHGTAGAGVEMLTDTEGVDFNDYLRRVYITVKQNWFAVMPASVQLGDQGVVSLQFRIMRDGSVPDGDPRRVFGSGKEPLDRAAISSIRASNPFPQLPGQFRGPYIELRFTYYYNLPIPTN